MILLSDERLSIEFSFPLKLLCFLKMGGFQSFLTHSLYRAYYIFDHIMYWRHQTKPDNIANWEAFAFTFPWWFGRLEMWWLDRLLSLIRPTYMYKHYCLVCLLIQCWKEGYWRLFYNFFLILGSKNCKTSLRRPFRSQPSNSFIRPSIHGLG